MTQDPPPDAPDPEMTRIVAEEEKALARVLANAHVQRNTSRKDYDVELIELRDAIGEARMEDVPALLAEMERLRNVATRRAEVTVGAVNTSSPYFGHMKIKEGGRVRDVLIGNNTYVDTDSGVRIVDWRDAPVSKIYYRYSEGDEYEEEIGGRTVEGSVVVRRAVVIRESLLRRVVAPQGAYYRVKGEWTRGADVSAKLEGGQGNLMFLTSDGDLPFWDQFTSTQTLLYGSPADLAAVRATPVPLVVNGIVAKAKGTAVGVAIARATGHHTP